VRNCTRKAERWLLGAPMQGTLCDACKSAGDHGYETSSIAFLVNVPSKSVPAEPVERERVKRRILPAGFVP
jgi:hypothetical protein